MDSADVGRTRGRRQQVTPMFVIGRQMLTGLQSKETLEQVIEKELTQAK